MQNFNAFTNTPVNTNFLTQLGYKLSIKKAQHVNFFAQEVTIPGMSVPPTHQATPLVNIPIWGEHVTYDELEVLFVVDSELLSYLELHHWLRGMGKPATYAEYRRLMNVPLITGDGLTSDIAIHVMSSLEEPKFEFIFEGAFPVSLGSMKFQATSDDVKYITVTAKFQYTLFNIRQTAQNWG